MNENERRCNETLQTKHRLPRGEISFCQKRETELTDASVNNKCCRVKIVAVAVDDATHCGLPQTTKTGAKELGEG